MTNPISLLRDWNGEDVRILKVLLETARDDRTISEDDFGEARSGILSRHSHGSIEDYIRGGMGYVSLIAVDASGLGLIASIWGEGQKEEDYDIFEPLLPVSLDEHLDQVSALLQKPGVHGRYDNLADALRLIAEVVGDMPINSLDELEQVLSILRETHDRIYERVLFDLENLEVEI